MLTRVSLVLLCGLCVWSRAQVLDYDSWAGPAVLSGGLCRYGNSVECCWGWRQTDQGRCEPHCQQGCKHGDCVGPDRCKCHPGYTGKACNHDLNECGLKPRPCKHRCMNTPGSYKCYCLDGHTLQPDGSCRNARTCYHANCQYGCEAIKGAVRCTCPSPGLRLGPDGRTCVDVDECVLGRAACPRRRKCVNTFGSFLCKCHLGFKLLYVNGRYTCTDKDTRPFCSLNPSSPKCRCEDGSCEAPPKVTVEPPRPRTMATTTTTTMTTVTITTPMTTTTTSTTPTTTTMTTSTTPTTTPMTTTTTSTTPTTTTMTTTTTSTTPTTTTMTTTTPTTTMTTTPMTTTMTTTMTTMTSTTPTTTTMTTTTPTTTTMTTTTPTTTTPATTSTMPVTTATPPPVTTTDATPPPTTLTPTTVVTEAAPLLPPTATATPVITTPSTTSPSSPVSTTSATTSTGATTSVALPATTPTAAPPATTVAPTATMPTTATTTVNSRVTKDVTNRQRGDVHIPRQPSHNHVWEFDIELGNTADYARDDPGVGVLRCTFDHGVCDWMSDRDGDLRWETARSAAGGWYLAVPELKAGQNSIRGARLAAQIVPSWSYGSVCFSFSHWLTGHHGGVLQLFVRTKGRNQRFSTALWSRTGGHGWRRTQVTLTTVDRVLLKAERRQGRRGKIAIDDVTLRQGACR